MVVWGAGKRSIRIVSTDADDFPAIGSDSGCHCCDFVYQLRGIRDEGTVLEERRGDECFMLRG